MFRIHEGNCNEEILAFLALVYDTIEIFAISVSTWWHVAEHEANQE